MPFRAPGTVFLGASQTFRVITNRTRCIVLCVLACNRKDSLAPGFGAAQRCDAVGGGMVVEAESWVHALLTGSLNG